MSDTDDRMDRAERIRRMHESREPGDDNEAAETADGEDAVETDGVTEPDDAATNGDSSGAEDDESIGTADTTDDVEGEESNMDVATDTDELAIGGTDSDGASEASDAPEQLVTGPRATDQQSTGGTAQATSADTDAAGAQPATTDEPETPANAVQQAASTAGDGETATSEAIAPLGGNSGFSLPSADELEAVTDTPGAEVDDDEMTAGAARSRGSAATATEPSVRVLEFIVGDQIYCLDIDEVEEIVKRESVTRVPNTEAYVEGVVDLRGQITTILDTKKLLDVDEDGPESLLVIFAPDAFEEHGTVGWVVDEVRQVVPVMESQVRTAPSEEEYVRGVVDRDDEDELIVWIRPGDAMASAVAVEDDD